MEERLRASELGLEHGEEEVHDEVRPEKDERDEIGHGEFRAAVHDPVHDLRPARERRALKHGEHAQRHVVVPRHGVAAAGGRHRAKQGVARGVVARGGTGGWTAGSPVRARAPVARDARPPPDRAPERVVLAELGHARLGVLAPLVVRLREQVLPRDGEHEREEAHEAAHRDEKRHGFHETHHHRPEALEPRDGA